ncbi:MAG: CYTH domain-containing protein [Magnetococcus sp. WYHC-3]
MNLEVEIKLTARTPAVLEAVLEDARVCALTESGSARRKQLDSVYYDSHNRALLAAQLAFRARHDGEKVRVTVKGTQESLDNGLSRRPEWEEQSHHPLTCFGDLPDGTLKNTVLAVVPPHTPLVPLLTTRMIRRTLILGIPDASGGYSRVELAADHGNIEANGQRLPLCELELELLDGPLDPVLDFARDLAQRHDLTPSSQSKFSLGLSLYADSQFY